MKKIEAVIRPFTVQDVKDALIALGVGGLTVTEVRGSGNESDRIEHHPDAEYTTDLVLVDVARVGYGLFVRKGAPKVEIQSVDAFKRSVLAARSITYIDPATGAPSGIYATRLMERLGIAAEVKPKTKLAKPGVTALEPVAKGDAEIGLGLTIAVVPGVELVGPLPAEIQSYTEYAVGLLVASKEAEAGKALITHLTSSAGQSILRSKGFEPR